VPKGNRATPCDQRKRGAKTKGLLEIYAKSKRSSAAGCDLAGKSTVFHMLSGASDSGEVCVEGPPGQELFFESRDEKSVTFAPRVGKPSVSGG